MDGRQGGGMTTELRAAARVESAGIQKTIWVRRSDRMPMLYWWSLPLSLQALGRTFAETVETARALVRPATALGACALELGAREMTRDVALVSDVGSLLEAHHEGRVRNCTIALFPPSRTEAELERDAPRFERDLERLAFTIAIASGGDGGTRHRFCFRIPGKVLEAIEALALGRRFGGNLGQVEMAFLQGLNLRPNQVMRLTLALHDGEVSLWGVDRAGRRRIYYLESGKGYTGTYEELGLREAVGERMREVWRRFPIGVVMFAGLPFFIGAFWAQNALSRRKVSDRHAPDEPPASARRE
jgi:hypothetical protein